MCVCLSFMYAAMLGAILIIIHYHVATDHRHS